MNKLISLKHLAQNLNKTTNPSNTFKSFYTLSKSPSISPQITPNLISPHLIQRQLHHCSPKTHAFFSNHVFFKQFSSISHFKGPINSFLGSRICMIRSQFPKFKLSNWSSSHKSNWSSWSQGYSTDNIVLGLIVANTAVFVLWRVLDRNFMYKNFTISVDNLKSGRIHTLITSAFSHIDLGHIASNMIGLYFFGSNIGRYLGPEYLLKLYFAGAVVGSIFYVVHHAFIVKMFQKHGTFGRDPSKVPGLGASGAVNAIMLLDIFLFPKATLMFDFFIPVPAILLGIYLIGQDVLRMLEGDQQISGSAHLGGAAVAAAAWLRLKKGRGFRF
ncbi:hypothetical protein RND81_13G109200 [Saponaria officinalis]|uniref:Peptidase S54 rhomboid domain-containing protein n=1 Tax=Saponaria officinalis TaxID=3572 RepID=A0AAW1GYD8_SAPOF